MNLIEALKTNKRIRRSNQEWFWPNAGGLLKLRWTSEDLLKDDWEVEPERYEFECKFKTTDQYVGTLIYSVDAGSHQFIKELPKNKRCRVTVEVIE